MNRNILKYMGGIATVLVVLSLFSTGALAFAQDRGMNEGNGHRMGGMNVPAMNNSECVLYEGNSYKPGEMPGSGYKLGEMQGNGTKMASSSMFASEMAGNGLLIASEDIFEDLTFEEVQEMLLECIDNRIEYLYLAQDRLDNDEPCRLSEEEITDGLATLESLQGEVADAADLADLENVRFTLVQEALEHSLDRKIERLNLAQLRLDNGYSSPMTEEEITDGLATLESLQEEVADAADLADLENVRFTLVREALEHSLDRKIERLDFAQLRLDNGYPCPLTGDEITDGLATLNSLLDDVTAAEDREDLDAIRDELKDLAGEFREGSGKEKSQPHPGNFGGNFGRDK